MSSSEVTSGTKEAHGYTWWWHKDSDDHLAFSGHEEPLYPIVRSLLPEGTEFVDVGAHVGMWSVRLSDKASHCHAFEANPITFRTLTENIAVNRLKNVTPYNVAIWHEAADLTWTDENGKKSGGSTWVHEAVTGEDSVKAITLDEALAFTPKKSHIGLVKCDVEGAEARVLAGAREILTGDRPNLFIEMHDMYQHSPANLRRDVEALLSSYGYRWSDSVRYGGGYYLTCKPEETWEAQR